MAAQRSSRKASDEDLIRLNSMGLSLGTIGRMLGVHPTTVTIRLQNLGIRVADTRRTFMEDVLGTLPPATCDWVADQLGPHHSIADFIRNLLTEAYVRRNQKGNPQ